MKRSTSSAVTERNSPVVERIKQLKSEHPFWGYRRIWAHLKYVDSLEVNKKRIFRLMQNNSLLVKPDTRLKALRTPGRSKPRPTRPCEWWGIDMTKVMVKDFGWMYIVVVLDWYTKKIVGYYAGIECRRRHWLEALNNAVNAEFPDGVKGRELFLMSDNGSQPTSVAFMKSCRGMGLKQAFTSYGNPKGNADTERVFRTMKEELLWLREWHSPFELVDSLGRWVESYGRSYLHSSLGYKSPEQFEKEYQNRQITLLVRTC
jgi:transposase InsO family protein